MTMYNIWFAFDVRKICKNITRKTGRFEFGLLDDSVHYNIP